MQKRKQASAGRAARPSSHEAPRRTAVIGCLFGIFCILMALISVRWWSTKEPEAGSIPRQSDLAGVVGVNDAAGDTTPDALAAIPGIESVDFNQALAPILARVDPNLDDWDSEVFSAAAVKQLKRLGQLITHPAKLTERNLQPLVTANFSAGLLRPEPLEEVLSDGSIVVRRSATRAAEESTLTGPRLLVRLLKGLTSPLENGLDRRAFFKIFRVETDGETVSTSAYFQAAAKLPAGVVQQNATWTSNWTQEEAGQPPRLKSISVSDYEEIVPGPSGDIGFGDWTTAVLGQTDSFRRQLVYGVDHWRNYFPRGFGIDLTGVYGLAVGDADGDGLDDVYFCHPEGLPNRLYLRNADGTLRDVSARSGTDWMENSYAALLVDLDNDADQDLLITAAFQLVILRNDGTGRFSPAFHTSGPATFISAAAADYDNDGDLDLFVCGYGRTRVPGRSNDELSQPTPYHDARNGGPNLLLRNDGELNFSNATVESGLGKENSRFSFAASWEDFDNDGDLDLYVANDFGRNNLYENNLSRAGSGTGGRQFIDVAATAGVEDISAGMGVTWGDYNNDGLMDLYISNMFSSAGGRIAYQRRFRHDDSDETLTAIRRHARGNTLFENQGDGTMADVSVPAAVTMGRWAWGTKFLDLNNDGLQDLYVANGYLTGDRADDL